MTPPKDEDRALHVVRPRGRARFLEQSIRLEEEQPAKAIRAGIYLTAVFIVCAIIWAGVTQVNEMVATPGEIVPAGLIHSVQHLEGGIVDEIYVRNGDVVVKGETLLHLLPSAPQADLGQVRTRRTASAIKMERLQAMIEDRQPDFADIEQELPAVARNELNIYAALNESHAAELAVLDRQIARQQGELVRQESHTEALGDEVEVARKQYAMQEELLAKNLTSRAAVLDREARLANLISGYKETLGGIRVIIAETAQTLQQRTEMETSRLSRLMEEKARVEVEIFEADQSLVKYRDRVRRLAVLAPVSGIVEGMSINSTNTVIDPGEDILKVIPADDELIVESRISTDDIGHVHAGQTADIKISSFDPSRFGTVKGVVKRVSATTYLDERKNPYFLAQITLEANHLGDDPTQLKIIPGMTVMADIQTGHKTVLDYLMKPVSRGFSNAFRER